MRNLALASSVGVGSFIATAVVLQAAPWLRDVSLLRAARADPPTVLAPLRDMLASSQTLFAKVSRPMCPTKCGTDWCLDVLRLDRATGRATLDLGRGRRISWDGQHVWEDVGRNTSPTQMGPEADAIASELVAGLLSGLAAAEIVPLGREAWHPRCTHGGCYDLSFQGTWDDDLAIVMTAREWNSRAAGVAVLDPQTGEPLKLGGRALDFGLVFEPNVRLEPDLAERENIESRTVTLVEADFDLETDLVTAGPAYLPPYHELSTRMEPVFDPATSEGTFVNGVEQPFAELGPVTCAGPGATTTVPIDLDFAVDPTHEYFAFLAEAETGGCPIRAGVRLVRQLRVGSKASASIDGQLVVRSGPTVLASTPFTESATGPAQKKFAREHVVSVPADFDPEALVVSLEGTLTVTCTEASATETRIRLGAEDEARPTLAWDGCFPEYGTFPDPASPPPLFPECRAHPD